MISHKIFFVIIVGLITLFVTYNYFQISGTDNLRKKIFPFEIAQMPINLDITTEPLYHTFKKYTSDASELTFLIKYKKFMDDPRTYSMAQANEINQMAHLVESVIVNKIDGDIVETGVWRGGMCMWTKALLKKYKSNKRVWLFDTFEYFPQAQSPLDRRVNDVTQILFEHMPTISDVKNNFKKFDLLDSNVIFIPGEFSKTTPVTPIDKISILRLDGDYYESTMVVLENYYFRIVNGGFVIIDDYNNKYLECKRAVDEFRSRYSITNPIINSVGAVYWQK
jgi:O-methyltransferase